MNKLKSTSRALYVIAGMFSGVGFEHINIPGDSVLIFGTFIFFFSVLAFASILDGESS